jgi:hypothetical protein
MIVEEITVSPKNLVVDDNEKFFVMNVAGPASVVIPENAAEEFTIGSEIKFLREATGTVTFSTMGAATLQSKSGFVTIAAQYSVAVLKKIAIDDWRLIGDIA